MADSIENKLKHLEFIQQIITRMNVNSFLLRGWSVTLVSALFAFATKDTNVQYILITYISTPLFWILDGYYLSQERKFRDLYETVRNTENDSVNFSMKTTNSNNNSWISSLFSKTEIIFYGTLIGITLIVIFVID